MLGFAQLSWALEKDSAANIESRLERDTGSESHIAQHRGLGSEMLKGLHASDEGVAQYARHYHDQLSQRPLIFFQHVSKTAGSSFCRLGHKNNCRAVHHQHQHDHKCNCHVAFDSAHWGNKDKDMPERSETCVGLRQQYEEANILFEGLEGNENYLIAESLCPDFWNVMLLRDPVDRLLSHMSMLAGWKDSAYSWVRTDIDPRMLFDKLPIPSNNFFIRSLLGKDAYWLPFGSITRAHLEEAKQVLERFDVLFIPDEANKTVFEIDIEATLLWQALNQTYNSRDGHTEKYRQSLSWTDGDWNLISTANALDLELWEHAKALYSIDRQVFMHPAFSKVSATMARGNCGHLWKTPGPQGRSQRTLQ